MRMRWFVVFMVIMLAGCSCNRSHDDPVVPPPPPTVTACDPNEGPEAGGISVTIAGANFRNGALLDVEFGAGNSAANVTFVDGTTITCDTPAGVGTVDVIVTNGGGQTGTLTNGFTYKPAPTVTACNPDNGPDVGSTSVTITGTNFVDGLFLRVHFDTDPASSVTFVDATTITCNTPSGAGTVNVLVVSGDGQTATLTNGFTYNPAPTVTACDPDNGPEGGGTFVTITGTNFVDGPSLDVEFGAGSSAVSVTVVDATTITCVTPAGVPGLVDVIVTSGDGQTATLTDGYTYIVVPPPTVTACDPNEGPEAGGISVTITGADFLDGAFLNVEFGAGNSAVSVTFVDATTITCDTPAGVGLGLVDVIVTNGDGQTATLAASFEYIPPPVADFVANPAILERGGSVDFTDLSTGLIDSWSWDLDGDGVEDSTDQHPSYTYDDPGIYTVSLTVTGPGGSDTETKVDYITVVNNLWHVDCTGGNDSNSGESWADAFATIQKGLDAASDEHMVLVADGTYTGTSNRNLDFGGKAIHLKSAGGMGSCIIDCEDSGIGFIFDDGETSDAIVEGFTIHDGNDNAVTAISGGNISCSNNSNPTIRDCTMTGGWAQGGGGAICCYSSSPTVINCVIKDNEAEHWGGAIWTYGGSSCSPAFINCLIVNNAAYHGVGAGCGVRCTGDSTPTFTNCTIADNKGSSSRDTGISLGYGAQVVLNNTIIWNNGNTDRGADISVYDGCSVTLNYCDYDPSSVDNDGTITPSNCINSDPLFVNAAGGDYSLQAGSACIDTGSDALVPASVTTDLAGNPRINITVDISAYEKQ